MPKCDRHLMVRQFWYGGGSHNSLPHIDWDQKSQWLPNQLR